MDPSAHPYAVHQYDAQRIQAAHAVSADAAALIAASDVVDLHLDTFIPPRLWGYDLTKRHGPGLLRGHFFGHLDFPRVLESGLSGAMWSITTNVFRSKKGRLAVFERNMARFRTVIGATRGRLRVVRTHGEYRAARAEGAHACLVAIQGGNALEASPDPATTMGGFVTRVTLVHLTSSVYGTTSSPLAWRSRGKGLTDAGRELVRALDEARVFVDLAHINPEGFWDAVAAHDKTRPLVATHTGVSGVRPHWRNLDDAQVKAIADSGGVIGIIYATNFLRSKGGRKDGSLVVDHMDHVIRVGGEDCVAIGTDYDGMITPPTDLRDGTSYARLVQHMLDRGYSEARIQKILGGNFLRAFQALRP